MKIPMIPRIGESIDLEPPFWEETGMDPEGPYGTYRVADVSYTFRPEKVNQRDVFEPIATLYLEVEWYVDS